MSCSETNPSSPLPVTLNMAPMVSPEVPLACRALTGDTIGHYKIERRIGRGGMGEVYEACDQKLNRKVAIKLVRPSLANVLGISDRFREEAKIAANLPHGRFVRVYHVDDIPAQHYRYGEPYMVMELLQGRTLRQVLSKGGSRQEMIAYFGDILEGMAYAHNKGLVHRDLKPENIFLTDDAEIKILDLGLAGMVCIPGQSQSEHIGLHHLREGSGAGTYRYMAPEMGSQAKQGTYSDVWSLGVLLYELLEGQHPYWDEDATREENWRRVCQGQYDRSRGLVGNAKMKAVIDQALCPTPTERYQNAGEMLEAFRRLTRRTIWHEWPIRYFGLAGVTISVLTALSAPVLLRWQRSSRMGPRGDILKEIPTPVLPISILSVPVAQKPVPSQRQEHPVAKSTKRPSKTADRQLVSLVSLPSLSDSSDPTVAVDSPVNQHSPSVSDDGQSPQRIAELDSTVDQHTHLEKAHTTSKTSTPAGQAALPLVDQLFPLVH